MSAQPKRVEFYCETCGSTDIGIDACAHWDIPSQKWEFTSTYDQTWCSTCGSEMIGERPAQKSIKGFRCAENVHVNPGFYIRPDDEMNFSPATVYPTEAEAWLAFIREP